MIFLEMKFGFVSCSAKVMATSKFSSSRSTCRSVNSSDTVTSGNSTRNSGSAAISWDLPKATLDAMRSTPFGSLLMFVICSSASLNFSATALHFSKKSRPSSVNVTPVLVRCSKRCPTWSSKCPICLLTADGVCPLDRDAAEMLPNSTTFTKTSICEDMSMAGSCPFLLRKPPMRIERVGGRLS